jgi:glycosyltransferase involved in cell wall biosynthesis
MIIGLNGQNLLVENPAGVEKFTHHLYKALAEIDKVNQYTVFFNQEPTSIFWQELTGNNANFKYKVIKNTKLISWTQMKLFYELLKNPVDIMFYPMDTITGFLTLLQPQKFKAVCMIHDLAYDKAKNTSNIFVKFIHFYTIWFTLVFAKIIVVPSENTKNEILKQKWFGFSKDKIKVIQEGVSDKFYKRNETEIANIRKKYNLDENPYLYFISTIQPRKNIPAMIEAFALYLRENANTPAANTKLVVSGKKGWQYEESLNAPKKYTIENNVIFLDYTPDEDTPVLLSGAKAFINVAVEEGFGLPLLEAIACKTPAIVSDIPAFKELGKDYPVYVNPNNIENIKTGIATVLNEQNTKNKEKLATDLAKDYTWNKTAESILEIFKNLHLNPKK